MKLEIKVPEVGESISEVTMGNWHIADGEFVEEDEVICEIESEKATVEVNAEKSGVIKQSVAEGETIAVGTVIGYIDTNSKADKKSEEDKPEEKDKKKKTEQPVQKKSEEETEAEQIDEKTDLSQEKSKSKISPVAANILNEAGINIANVEGTGEGGRVTKKDALKVISDQKIEKTEESPAQSQTARVQQKEDRSERRVKMSTLRKTIARRMLEAKHGTAMLTTFNEIDMSHVIAVRKKFKEMFQEKHGIGLGFMSFFTKACCHALREEQGVNAMIDGEEIVYYNYCDIGIAVSTEKGLVVPVIRNADKLSLADIEREINALATKARDGKLTIDEMSGGTFSITNGGVFGSLMATPIINAPQSAILGMHAIKDRAVVIDGEIVIRPMMYIALSYDHRIIDGKESVTFLKRVKELLEDPIRLILDV